MGEARGAHLLAPVDGALQQSHGQVSWGERQAAAVRREPPRSGCSVATLRNERERGAAAGEVSRGGAATTRLGQPSLTSRTIARGSSRRASPSRAAPPTVANQCERTS